MPVRALPCPLTTPWKGIPELRFTSHSSGGTVVAGTYLHRRGGHRKRHAGGAARRGTGPSSVPPPSPRSTGMPAGRTGVSKPRNSAGGTACNRTAGVMASAATHNYRDVFPWEYVPLGVWPHLFARGPKGPPIRGHRCASSTTLSAGLPADARLASHKDLSPSRSSMYELQHSGANPRCLSVPIAAFQHLRGR
jgi:hypothetical protein